MSEQNLNSCLIFGLSGVGKSTLVKDLRQRNKNAYDGDDVPGLAHWYDATGKIVPWQSGREWRANHYFYWNEIGLKTLFAEQPQESTLYIAGVAQNLSTFMPVFQHLVLLEASVETIIERRQSPSRFTPYPYEHLDEDTEPLRGYVDDFREKALSLGATIINAELDTATISQQIITVVEG